MSLRRHRISDAKVLHCLRRRAILELSSIILTPQQAQDWASRHTVESMTERLGNVEGWVEERDDTVVGWVSLKADYIDGLYVDPGHARQGVASNLLRHLEEILSTRGIALVRTDASLNAVEFYIRRGYELQGLISHDGAVSLVKRLSAAEQVTS